MTTKKKILISCIAGVLVVALGVVGVLAATAQTINLTTNVGFTATSVVADVKISAAKTGTGAGNIIVRETDGTGDDGIISFVAGEAADGESTRKTKSATIDTVNFVKDNVVTYTIYVINNSTSRGITATVPTATDEGNVVNNLSLSFNYYTATEETGETTSVTPTNGNTVTMGVKGSTTGVLKIIIVANITDKAFDVESSNLNFSVSLEAVTA